MKTIIHLQSSKQHTRNVGLVFELFKLMLKFVILWWWRVYFHVRFRSNAAEQIHRNKNESDKIIFEWHKHYAGSNHLWMWSSEWARNSGKMMEKQSKHKTGYWLKSFHCYNQRESWANNQRNSIICSEKLVLMEQMFHFFLSISLKQTRSDQSTPKGSSSIILEECVLMNSDWRFCFQFHFPSSISCPLQLSQCQFSWKS